MQETSLASHFCAQPEKGCMNMKSNPLLWLVLGGLVLAGIYFAVTKTPMSTSDSTELTKLTTPEPTALLTIPLATQSNLGQSGSASFTENPEGKVVVTLALTGGSFAAAQPAHIHVGACPTPGAVKYPLTDVVEGSSTTVLPVTWAELEAAGEKLALNVHKSAAESKVYTACGDLVLVPTVTETDEKKMAY
jgi:hypothetical protein